MWQVSQGKMSVDEMLRRMHPKNTEFMRLPLDLPNGERTELSYANIVLSLARTLGDTAEIMQGEKDFGPGEKNPWLRFARNRFSPIASTAQQIITGKDYQGEDISATKAVTKSFVPISLTGLADDKSGQTKVLQTGSQFFGLNAYSESLSNERKRKLDIEAKKKYGNDYKNLTVDKRLRVARVVESSLDKDKKPISTKQITQAIEHVKLNGKKVQAKLSDEVAQALESRGLEVPGYQDTRTLGGSKLRLTEAEKEVLFEFQLEETEKRLRNLLIKSGDYFDKKSEEGQKETLKAVIEAAHDVAWRKTIKEINRISKGK